MATRRKQKRNTNSRFSAKAYKIKVVKDNPRVPGSLAFQRFKLLERLDGKLAAVIFQAKPRKGEKPYRNVDREKDLNHFKAIKLVPAKKTA